MNSAREEILSKARAALGRRADSPIAPAPASARVAPRVAGDTNSEIEMLLSEIAKLGGTTRRVSRKSGLKDALRQLVETEAIKKATLWQTQEIDELWIEELLRALGVEIISPHSDKYALAECDLGVTSVDSALPETGTLLLRSSPERPRLVSLLPRVHLAILSPSALRADVSPALAQVKGEGYWIFITGPSRTSDIELTMTIGVHGPKALHVWIWDE
jgi:L-lactate dehydrogenase complex protein LldG